MKFCGKNRQLLVAAKRYPGYKARILTKQTTNKKNNIIKTKQWIIPLVNQNFKDRHE
jgi:hypothetical protein